MTWRYMCQREVSMVVTCAWCEKQVIDGHDCPEKRAALANEPPTVAEILYDAEEGEGKE